MTKFEKIELIWNNLEASYVKLGKGMSPTEFVKKLLNYDETGMGKRALLKIVRESGEEPARIEKLANKIEKVHDNLEYCIQHSISVSSVQDFLRSNERLISVDDLSVNPMVKQVSVEQLADEGHLLPVRRLINDGGLRKLCVYECTDYRYVCQTESEVVQLFQELKSSYEDRETLFGLAACISAGSLGAPLIVANTVAKRTIQDKFTTECKKYIFNEKEYEMLNVSGAVDGIIYVLLVEEACH